VARREINATQSTFKTDPLWWLIIAAGVFLRLWIYFGNRSFSADEASLAYNLVTRDFSGLTQPLDYQQGAPIGFLFIEKIFLLVFGNSEYALRILPLVSGILALFVLYLIAKKYFNTSGLFAMFAFAIAWSLVYYSSEFKQYSSDTLIALSLIYLASRCVDEEARAKDFILLGVSGVIAIWISHPSFFILAGIGLLLLVEKFIYRKNTPLVWIAALGAAWLASFALEYWVSLQYLVSNKYLERYWSKAFLPMPPWSDWRWFPETYTSLAGISLSAEPVSLVLITLLGIWGIASLYQRSHKAALLLTLPVLMTAFASAAQRYPLKGRFMLFLIPFLLFFISEGLAALYRFASRWNRNLALAASLLPALWLVFIPFQITYAESQTAMQVIGVRPAVEYVASHRTPGDIIYVYHGADPAFHYYAPLFGMDMKDKNIIFGESLVLKKRAFDSFLDDVRELQGSERVWFIFSDIVDCGGCTGDMQTFYVNLLDGVGNRLDQFNGIGANAYLYDMTR
jgi:hypothetical protein